MPSLILFAWLWSISAQVLLEADAAWLTGRVIDAATLAPIPDVRVVAAAAGPIGRAPDEATQTGPDGRFVFPPLPAGPYTISVSTVGYIFVRRAVVLVSGDAVELSIPLTEGTGAYRETVDVTAGTDPPAIEAMSQSVLGSAGLQDLRGIATDDPLRAVQALPGVATGDDFRSEFSVRGSAFRHTGVVVDGSAAPLLLHTVRGESNTGSIAMINSDVLDRARLQSGSHARKHGDWIGATVEFDMREGSRDRTALRAAVSGTSASVVAEGPIGPGGRASWIVSLRRSYLDWLIRKVEPGFSSTLGFYDGYAKLVFDLTPRHQVQVMAIAGDATYRGSDVSRTNGLARAVSSSTLGSVAWRYAGARTVLTSRVAFTGSRFRNTGVLDQELARGYLQGLTGRIDLTVLLPRGWSLEAGALGERQRMNEIARVFRTAPAGAIAEQAVRDRSPRTTLRSAWAQVSRVGDSGSLAAGLRVSDRTLSSRTTVRPWLLAERRTGPVTWRAGAGASGQFPDPLFVMSAGLPIEPEESAGADVGVVLTASATTEWHALAFSRSESGGLRLLGEPRLEAVTGLRQPAGLFPEYRPSIEGTSRGVEFVVMRRAPAGLSGWIGYTWARTRLHDTISGERFDADFDQRHTLNAVLTLRLSYRTTAGAKLRVGSNVPITGYLAGTPEDLHLSAVRNGVRLPAYARLDLRAARTFTFEARRLTLFVEVMNALGRRNYGQADGVIRNTLAAVGFVERLIPRVPSAGILVEF